MIRCRFRLQEDDATCSHLKPPWVLGRFWTTVQKFSKRFPREVLKKYIRIPLNCQNSSNSEGSLKYLQNLLAIGSVQGSVASSGQLLLSKLSVAVQYAHCTSHIALHNLYEAFQKSMLQSIWPEWPFWVRDRGGPASQLRIRPRLTSSNDKDCLALNCKHNCSCKAWGWYTLDRICEFLSPPYEYNLDTFIFDSSSSQNGLFYCQNCVKGNILFLGLTNFKNIYIVHGCTCNTYCWAVQHIVVLNTHQWVLQVILLGVTTTSRSRQGPRG